MKHTEWQKVNIHVMIVIILLIKNGVNILIGKINTNFTTNKAEKMKSNAQKVLFPPFKAKSGKTSIKGTIIAVQRKLL